MRWFVSFVKYFVVIFAGLALASYTILTVGPLLGICFGIIYAACQSGSTWFLFGAVWLVPAFIALVTSPAMIDYAELRRQRKIQKEKEEDEADR